MKTYKLIPLLFMLACGGGGGGGAHPYTGTWIGYAQVHEDNCGFTSQGVPASVTYTHHVNIDGSSASIQSGNVTLHGIQEENKILVERTTHDNCTTKTGIAYVVASSNNHAGVGIIIQSTCGGLTCRVSYLGEASK